MPNPVLMKNGLWIPQSTFPDLVAIAGTNQAGVAPFVQPVVIVSPYSASEAGVTSGNALLPSGGTTPLAPAQTNENGLGVPIGHVTWTPHTTVFNIANNLGIVVYRLQITGVKGVRLEWVRADFSANTVAPPAPMYQLAVVDGLDTVTEQFNITTKAHWSTGRQEAGGSASENYYTFHARKYNPVYTGQPTDRLGLTAVTPTLWMDTPLPDMVIPTPCTICIAFRTAVAAGGGLDDVFFKVRATLFN